MNVVDYIVVACRHKSSLYEVVRWHGKARRPDVTIMTLYWTFEEKWLDGIALASRS